MKTLFIFLVVALISTYFVTAKSKSKIWISAILTPIIALVGYALIIATYETLYVVGQEVAKAILPAIISGTVIYFQLRRKLSNNKVKFPFILVSVIVVSLMGWIYTAYTQMKIDRFLNENKDVIMEDVIEETNIHFDFIVENKEKKYVLNIDGTDRTIDSSKFESKYDEVVKRYPNAQIRVYSKDETEGNLPISQYRDAVSKGDFKAYMQYGAICLDKSATLEKGYLDARIKTYVQMEKLYNTLVSTKKITSEQLGDKDTFVNGIDSPEKADKLFDTLISQGYFTAEDIGDRDRFKNSMWPDATTRYSVGNKRYNIPTSKRSAFLQRYPEAKIYSPNSVETTDDSILFTENNNTYTLREIILFAILVSVIGAWSIVYFMRKKTYSLKINIPSPIKSLLLNSGVLLFIVAYSSLLYFLEEYYFGVVYAGLIVMILSSFISYVFCKLNIRILSKVEQGDIANIKAVDTMMLGISLVIIVMIFYEYYSYDSIVLLINILSQSIIILSQIFSILKYKQHCEPVEIKRS